MADRRTTPSGAAAQAAAAEQAYWRSFPQFETLLATGAPALLTKVEDTCRRLDLLARNGSPQEQARARAALAAYARSLELYRTLAELRDDAAASNPARGRSENKVR